MIQLQSRAVMILFAWSIGCQGALEQPKVARLLHETLIQSIDNVSPPT